MLCYHCVDRERKLDKLPDSVPRTRFGGISLCEKCFINECIRDDALRPAIHTDLLCDACYRRRQETWAESLGRDPDLYEEFNMETSFAEVAAQNNKWKTTGQKDCCMRFMTSGCQNYMNAQEQKEWEAGIVSRLTFV